MQLSTLVLLVTSVISALAAPAPTPTTTTSFLRPREEQATPTPAGSITSTNINSISTKLIIITGVTESYVTIPEKTITLDIPTCVQTTIPDKNGHVPAGSCGSIWNYYPSFEAATVFAVLFALLTAVHIWQAAYYKKSFCWVIIMAGIWETAAFTFRSLSTRNQQSQGIYLVYQIFILLAPLWVNAFDYMVLGRMIYYYIPSRSLLGMPEPIIAALFVLLDIVSFVVQLVGGSMAGPSAPPQDQLRAIHVYMGGIGMQQGFIVLFLFLAIRFHVVMGRAQSKAATPNGWRPLVLVLYASLAFITIRIIFRLVEFSRGADDLTNPLLTQEVYFYILEAAPMFLALLSLAVVHPGRFLVGSEADMPGLFKTIKDMRKTRSEWAKLGEGDELSEVGRR
ncbi:uncharacterized protein E0L32_003530 [Thyridium curvatum]|uniref:RTA1-like protein n=1 Tax=Thyridium curvatum TaxID=1093900 RepID=A0A507BJU8_9PEZI|nr:uncharacterized protein E0L32_003530 [Thyridium curvatum]TPX16968.1 hypothetical protein E0L32_003530 [Thyridium curvatum]